MKLSQLEFNPIHCVVYLRDGRPVKTYEQERFDEVKFFNAERADVVATPGTDGEFTLTGVQKGDVVETSSFIYVADADVMEIGGEGVGRSFSMFLEETVMNNDMEVIATKTTFFPRVVPDSSFTMEGTSELAEQNVTYTFTVVQADGFDYLGQIYYISE